MIQWIKIEAGEYESNDGRFYIVKTWDRYNGNHWDLYDKNNPEYFKGLFHEQTLNDCKLKAEIIVNNVS